MEKETKRTIDILWWIPGGTEACEGEALLQSLKFKVESRYQDDATHVTHCRIVAWREAGSERRMEEAEKVRRKDCMYGY